MKNYARLFLVTIILLLVFLWFRNERVSLPSEQSITQITVKLDGYRPEVHGYLTNHYTLTQSDYGLFMKLLVDSKRTLIPIKWQSLGTIKLTTSSGQITTIDLFSTFQTRGAFDIDGKSFRTLSEPAMMKFLMGGGRTKGG